jgi:hypothetical protein
LVTSSRQGKYSGFQGEAKKMFHLTSKKVAGREILNRKWIGESVANKSQRLTHKLFYILPLTIFQR